MQTTIPTSDDALEHIRCHTKINTYKSFHKRALARIEELKIKHKVAIQNIKAEMSLIQSEFEKKLNEANGKIKKLNKQLFGKKSEKNLTKPDSKDRDESNSTRSKGMQVGSKGHGRRRTPKELPIIEEIIDLDEQSRTCSHCEGSFEEISSFEESEVLEIEVKGFVRKIKRKKYKTCSCSGKSKIITAPKADKLYPKAIYGVSIWWKVLSNKYIYSVPTARTLKELSSLFGKVSSGTIVDGLKKISSLFDPMMNAFDEKLMTENYFHCDETYWKVYEKLENKENYNWYIWGFFSKSVRYYHFSETRATSVLKEVFANIDTNQKEIIIVCDRYSAYQCFVKDNPLFILAFCWAHVRRDFLDVATSNPLYENWAFEWIERIRRVYQINKNRLSAWKPEKILLKQNKGFQKHQKTLASHLLKMKKMALSQLSAKRLHRSKKKVLNSLINHWDGLTVFESRPFVKLDNNTAEQEVRLNVVGRKNFYGSGSIWSAKLSGKLYSFVKTYELWGLDASKGLYYYLKACEKNKGAPPEDISDFIPWKMTEERKDLFKKILVIEPVGN